MDIPNNWSKEKLVGIIHALRMHNFSNVEDQALDEIKSMIKVLPLPEKLDQIFNSAMVAEVKNIQGAVGGIMRLVELYGKRDNEFKVRYKSRTKLPPRYDVLIDLPRQNTQIELERAAMNNKHNLVNDLLKLSSEADQEGFYKFAQDLIGCAKIVMADKIPIKELYACTMGFSGDSLVKTSQLTDINLDFGEIVGGLNQITELFKGVETAIQNKFQYLQQSPKTQKFIKPLQEIWKQIDQLSKTTTTEAQSVNKAATEMSGAMGKELTPNSMMVNGKPTEIQWGEPDKDGYQSAFVTVNGKKFEVQEDEQGKRTLKPMEAMEPTEKIPEVTEAPETFNIQPKQPIAETPTNNPPTDIGTEQEKTNNPEQKWAAYKVDYAKDVAPIIQPLIDNQTDKIDYNKIEELLKKIDTIKATMGKVFNLKLMKLALGAPIAMPTKNKPATPSLNQQLIKSMLQSLISGDLNKVNTATIRKQLENIKNPQGNKNQPIPSNPNAAKVIQSEPASDVKKEVAPASDVNPIPVASSDNKVTQSNIPQDILKAKPQTLEFWKNGINKEINKLNNDKSLKDQKQIAERKIRLEELNTRLKYIEEELKNRPLNPVAMFNLHNYRMASL